MSRGRVLAVRLVRREKAQHAPRGVGVEPEHLHRGEDAVAAEHGREPRHAGVRIRAERRLGLEHREIGARARQDGVDGDVGGLDLRQAGAVLCEAALGAPHGGVEACGARGLASAQTLHEHAHGAARARFDVELELGAAGRKSGRRRIEADARLARNAIERPVDEGDFRRPALLGDDRAAPAARVAADLEQVGEVGAEFEREPHSHGLVGVVGDGEELVAARLPQELGARHVESVLREHQPVALEQVRVGQVDVEREVVGLDRGAQDERPVAFEREEQARQEAGIEVEQPRGAVLDLDHVAELVEHGEAVVVLERAPAGGGKRDDARDA